MQGFLGTPVLGTWLYSPLSPVFMTTVLLGKEKQLLGLGHQMRSCIQEGKGACPSGTSLADTHSWGSSDPGCYCVCRQNELGTSARTTGKISTFGVLVSTVERCWEPILPYRPQGLGVYKALQGVEPRSGTLPVTVRMDMSIQAWVGPGWALNLALLILLNSEPRWTVYVHTGEQPTEKGMPVGTLTWSLPPLCHWLYKENPPPPNPGNMHGTYCLSPINHKSLPFSHLWMWLLVWYQ